MQLRTAHECHLLLSVPELLHQAGTDKETERIGGTLQKVPRLSGIRKERDVPRLLPPHVLSHRNQLQDLLLARKNNLVNGRLEYIREKTHKKYSIRIEPEAEELLKRYKGSDYLLRAMDGCKHYKSFAHEMNDHLKMIGEEVVEMVPDPEDLFGTPRQIKTVRPVIPGISTYYARHCWATFVYGAGVPLDVISQALGHSSGNRTTGGYNHFFRDGVGPISGAYLSREHIPLQPARKTFSVWQGGDISHFSIKAGGVFL